jgi:hypothetical protein
MIIKTENCEIDYSGGLTLYLRRGNFALWCSREQGQPFWWFARQNPGESWQRWGFGFTLIMGDGRAALAAFPA